MIDSGFARQTAMSRIPMLLIGPLLLTALSGCDRRTKSEGATWRILASDPTLTQRQMTLPSNQRLVAPFTISIPHLEVAATVTYLGPPGRIAPPRIIMTGRGGAGVEPYDLNLGYVESDDDGLKPFTAISLFGGELHGPNSEHPQLQTGETFQVRLGFARRLDDGVTRVTLRFGDAPAITLPIPR